MLCKNAISQGVVYICYHDWYINIVKCFNFDATKYESSKTIHFNWFLFTPVNCNTQFFPL